MTQQTQSLPSLNERQQRLIEILLGKSKEVAVLYEGALRVLSDRSNPARDLLAAHALRELMGRLPTYVDLPVCAATERLGDQVRSLEEIWNRTDRSACRKGDSWAGEIDAPLRKLLIELGKFFKWWRESHPKRRELAGRLFRHTDPAGLILPPALQRPREKRWLDLNDYFVAIAHGGKTDEREFKEALNELDQVLLDCFYRQPSGDFSAIDAILAEEIRMPNPEVSNRALREIKKGYAQYQYFFDNLTSPKWLKLLSDGGFFHDPPEPIPEGNYIRFPEWPESRYLVRMASLPEAQEIVLEIALTVC